jgi:hypothetical protein
VGKGYGGRVGMGRYGGRVKERYGEGLRVGKGKG